MKLFFCSFLFVYHHQSKEPCSYTIEYISPTNVISSLIPLIAIEKNWFPLDVSLTRNLLPDWHGICNYRLYSFVRVIMEEHVPLEFVHVESKSNDSIVITKWNHWEETRQKTNEITIAWWWLIFTWCWSNVESSSWSWTANEVEEREKHHSN